jgi:hypothetical protein
MNLKNYYVIYYKLPLITFSESFYQSLFYKFLPTMVVKTYIKYILKKIHQLFFINLY